MKSKRKEIACGHGTKRWMRRMPQRRAPQRRRPKAAWRRERQRRPRPSQTPPRSASASARGRRKSDAKVRQSGWQCCCCCRARSEMKTKKKNLRCDRYLHHLRLVVHHAEVTFCFPNQPATRGQKQTKTTTTTTATHAPLRGERCCGCADFHHSGAAAALAARRLSARRGGRLRATTRARAGSRPPGPRISPARTKSYCCCCCCGAAARPPTRAKRRSWRTMTMTTTKTKTRSMNLQLFLGCCCCGCGCYCAARNCFRRRRRVLRIVARDLPRHSLSSFPPRPPLWMSKILRLRRDGYAAAAAAGRGCAVGRWRSTCGRRGNQPRWPAPPAFWPRCQKLDTGRGQIHGSR